MLVRAPDRRRRAASARQRRYRRRQREGSWPVTIEINAAIVNLLIAAKWLGEPDAADRPKITAAIEAMLAETAAQN
jgi:hypothetical protein